MPKKTNLNKNSRLLSAGGNKKPAMKVASAKTLAGQYRQVAEGKALKTRGGLTAKDIVQNKSGRWVSKAKSERMQQLSGGGSSNPWWNRMQEAKTNGEEQFEYTNTKGDTFTYVRHTTKTGLDTYKKA